MMHMFFQIWSWVMQPEVWRFVGFASAVVGLLCYALSSSFNYLFGSWNLWKIILYTVFSFIICSAVLFAKIWQQSRTLQFKAHIAFLVLTITSLYSFYYDKVVNGQPDAYSLITCVSFAIMSLSLSRKKTQCGFEIDLLYFFLGCLLVQLMKIKLLLFFVGTCFSYSLIILRTCFSSMDASLDNELPNSLQDENNHVVVEVHSDSAQQTQVMNQDISDLQKKEKGIQEQNNMLLKRSSHITHDKAYMTKLVLKLDIHDYKIKQKAMKAATSVSGIDSVSMDTKDKKMTLIGDIDPLKVVAKLRKICHAEIVSVGPVKEEKKV
ncbi:uncharacterized protein LOC131610449 [Vicia villosa]|uniref:uncharacterized protein LOC131610449 n=1 Tax=Vicia villosa TaxID=3911 RepID=UPI00273B8265|nr:uncharacterized protein LOC131610449 [Vicia villosa]